MAPDVKALVTRMQGFYEKTADFTASFRQDYTYKSFNRTQTSTGKVSFLKPAMMRWDYEKPAKTFVLSGDKAYAYDPEAMTLTIAGIKSNELSAAVTFLWGAGRLEKEFSIARQPCSECQGVLLELTPLGPEARFQKVKLEVDPKTAQVLRTIVIDPDGSENAIAFSELKINPGVSKEQFKIKTPKDTQVVDLTKAQN
jgi:outer membrane lipoprotein carrier protein